jgi:Spy/CpxP family protein refolding chaperone
MPKSKLSAVISLLLVFVSGALVGVLAHRAYTMKIATAGPAMGRRPGPPEWRKHFLADMRERVKLNDGQTAQVTAILEQVDGEFRQVREKWNTENQAIQKSLVERIDAILTPDQQVLYQRLRDEREAERQRWHQQKQSEKK